MEAYSGSPTTTAAVLAFLSAWTTELHAAGYLSGVYGSASSVITDMVNAQGTTFVEPDEIWITDWNGLQTVSDPYVPSSEWAGFQRLHQYSGDQNECVRGDHAQRRQRLPQRSCGEHQQRRLR